MNKATNPYFGMSPMPYEKKMQILAERYTPQVHRIGVPIALIHVVIMMLPGLALWFFYGVWPGWKAIVAGATPIWLMCSLGYFMDPIQYFVALGTVGTYVSFLAGNVGNIRLPCAIATEAALGVEPGTPEGEIVGGLAMIASQWVLVVVTLTAALLVTMVVGSLPKPVTDSFEFLLPGLFGGMLIQVGLSSPRYAAVAVLTALVLYFLHFPGMFLSIVTVFFMMALSGVLFSRGIWVPTAMQQAEIRSQSE